MNKLTIFLIDEDNNSRPAFRSGLKSKGYHVSIAVDEEDALDRIAHECIKADLVLMSLIDKLPEETLEIGRNICRRGKLDVFIVVLAQKYGDDMEGKDVQISEKEYISYLDDGEQLYRLLSRLLSTRTIE